MSCYNYQCPDGSCVDTRFDCESHHCTDAGGNLTYSYCAVAKMCIQAIHYVAYCVACTANVTTPYRCNSGQCADKERFCDDQYDCLDNSDELSYECRLDTDNDSGGFKFPSWIFQVIGPVIGIGIAIIITYFKRKRIMKMRAVPSYVFGLIAPIALVFAIAISCYKRKRAMRMRTEQARQNNGQALAPGAVNTGNMPPPPPGCPINPCAPAPTAGAPPSYSTAMKSSQPSSSSRSGGGWFGGLFSSGNQTRPGPPSYNSATGAGYPTQGSYPAQAVPMQPQPSAPAQANYNTQYGMAGQNSAFTYS